MSKTTTLQDDPAFKAIAEEQAFKRRNGIQEELQPDIPDGEHFGVRSGYWARVWDGKNIHEFKTRGGVRNTFKAPGRDKFEVKGGKVLLKGRWEGDLPDSMTQKAWDDLHANERITKKASAAAPHKPSYARKPTPKGVIKHKVGPNAAPQRPAIPGRSAVAASAPLESGPAPAASNAYTVQSGDTLSGIAQRNNTTVDSIMEANPSITDPNRIQAGASVNLGGSPQPAPAPQAAQASAPSPAKPVPPEQSQQTEPQQPSGGPAYEAWGEHLWNAENAAKEGYDPATQQWNTYWDDHGEGKGSWAVGPGINVAEQGKYTREQIDRLHRKSMDSHWEKARSYYEGFDDLSRGQQHFLAGGKYLGVNHPSFYAAARAGKPTAPHMTYENDRRERLEREFVNSMRGAGINKQNSVAEPLPTERPKTDIAGPALRTAAMLASVPVGINALGHVSQRFIPAEHRELVRASGAVASSPIIYGGRKYAMSAAFNPTGRIEGGGKLQQGLARTIAPGGILYNQDGWNAKGILAHELGHMMNYRDGADFSDYGKGLQASAIAAGLAGLTRNAAKTLADDKSLQTGKVIRALSRKRYLPLAAAASLIPFAPTLKEETVASHRGGKLLAGETGNPLDYVKAFAGLPTYYGLPLIPGAAFAAMPEGRRAVKSGASKAGKLISKLVRHAL